MNDNILWKMVNAGKPAKPWRRSEAKKKSLPIVVAVPCVSPSRTLAAQYYSKSKIQSIIALAESGERDAPYCVCFKRLELGVLVFTKTLVVVVVDIVVQKGPWQPAKNLSINEELSSVTEAAAREDIKMAVSE